MSVIDGQSRCNASVAIQTPRAARRSRNSSRRIAAVIAILSQLYTEDAVWETPARGVSYKGRETIKKMYLRVFNSAEGITFHPVERFATPDRVFDDMWATFRLSGDGFENSPFPIGTKVRMRLLHNFHIRDGMIAKEIGYEIWRRDE